MDPPAVSPREREVLGLLGDHLTHEEIARRLFISVRTVESHVASLRRKLDLPDHRALVRYAAALARVPARRGPAGFAPLTSFVGRAAELAALTDAVRAARVVTAAGPGGAGKTRLAVAAAEALSPELDDVRWVDLVPVTDPARLADTVALACEAPVSSRLGPVEALALAFADRPVLLVLDNAEHMLDPVAVLTERLVAACPGLRVLITSRARLALPVERVFRVEGLSPGADGDATRLFVERATAAGSPRPGHVERARIAAVCDALGGLPLAVELAAVRMPVLGLDGVERALVDQTALLRGGSRIHPRHRSMHETLDWSVALLDPPSVRVLGRLAVLLAPFDGAAAEAVAAFPPLDTDAVRDALAQLVEQSLLATAAAAGRLAFRMLEPVRQYALGRLDASDRPVHEHHLRWCGAVLRALIATDDGPAVRDVAPDARAALAWAERARAEHQEHPAAAAAEVARDLGLLLYRDGSLGEAQQRFELAASFAPDDASAAADLARAAAVAKCRVVGEDALRLELAAAERAQSAGSSADAACALGRAVELLNRFPGTFARPPGSAMTEELLRRARDLAGDDVRARATLAVAECGYASAAGAPSGRRALLALEAARAAGDPALESSALDALIAAALFAGDVVQAHRAAQQRLRGITRWRAEPAQGLELKDGLHMATLCALGAGDLAAAADAAARQQRLPFLRERRDLADDEVAAPAALAGDLATALLAGQRFLQDWTAAGRPAAAGRGLTPAAVALAHGLGGDHESRSRWLDILAQVRDVPVEEAGRGTGYGELFEALVQLDEGRPDAALAALRGADGAGLLGVVFGAWIAAVQAEAGVLAGADDTEALLTNARERSRGNPVATALTERAAALLRGDPAALRPLADTLDAAGAGYQAERTRRLAAGDPSPRAG